MTWAVFYSLALAALTLAIDCVFDIVQALRNSAIPIKGNFEDLVVSAPIGPAGSAVDLEVVAGLFEVSSLDTMTVTALVFQQLVVITALLSCTWLGFRFLKEILAGRLFTASNSRTLTRMTLALAFAVPAYLGLGSFVSHRAIEHISKGAVHSGSSNPNTLVLLAVLLFTALVTLTFRHIQADQEAPRSAHG